ncbi:MAG: APC family permease, partial [Actinomycetota bacterium]|nr:APC family permease [Actinomycetota bacterium]
VLAQIGETVWGGGTMFFVLQVFTALILILAANTAYQDFPRLSAILARDGFVPRQFQNRGDRLVFSNGIVVLSALAMLLVWVFDADLTRLIQLYVVGVFTAFTLSQTGMVRRWMRLKEPGWRRSAVINGIGATATGIVLVIVAITKFEGGAWIVISAMPVIVLFFTMVKRHYDKVRAVLAAGRVPFGQVGRNVTVLVVTHLDAATAKALGYVRGLRPAELRVLYAGDRPPDDVGARWKEMAPEAPPLTLLGSRGQVDAIVEYVREIPREPDDFITVVIPELFERRSLFGALLKPVTFRLKLRLLAESQVVITDVPVLVEDSRLVGVDGSALIPERMEAVVFVASVQDSAVRAVNYAMTLNAHETRAVFLATEPEEAPEFLEAWARRGIGVQLDVVEAPFRDLGPPLLEEVRRITDQPGTVAAVVLPEFLVTRWWHRILHNNRALFVKRQLLFEPRVILSSVPYQIGRMS